MKLTRMVFVLVLAGLNALAVDAATTRRALTPDDIYKMESVSELQLSPDGQWVAYLVTTSDRAADETRTAVWMVSWDGAQQRQLTDPADSIGSPRWSPDSRHLAYLGKPAGAEHRQLMLLDPRGGEPRALTSVNGDIDSFAWSPDGKRMVLVIETDGDALTATGASAGKAPRPIVIDSMYFKEDVTGYISDSLRQHLYLFDPGSAKLEALGADPAYNDVLPAWSPDGTQLAFVRTRERLEDLDGQTDIDLIDARPNAIPHRLVRVYAPNAQHLVWSPDGKLLTYLQGLEPKYYIYLHDELAAVPASGGAPRALTARLDRAVMSHQFAPDGKSITLLVEDDGSQYPARLDLATLAIERMIRRPMVVSAQSAAGAHLAIVASDDTTASEVYAFEPDGPRRLTHHGDKLLNDIELGAVEDFSFHSKDGTEVHGLMVKPPGYVAGRKYPLIVWLHGGPDLQDDHSADFDAYQSRRQMFAAGGFVVIGINHRGSSGRGLAFASAIFADWGHKDVEDVLAAVDTMVARGIADPARLGIGGLSYGGILTNYTIAKDGRFKAAVSRSGTGNVLAQFGTDQYWLWDIAELGPPWRNTSLWLKQSYPFFHADRIHTPTLFFGGDRDFNVPIAGSEQMYMALRTLGVPTQLVVYPGEYHELARPSFIKDYYQRVIAWFGKYLQTAP